MTLTTVGLTTCEQSNLLARFASKLSEFAEVHKINFIISLKKGKDFTKSIFPHFKIKNTKAREIKIDRGRKKVSIYVANIVLKLEAAIFRILNKIHLKFTYIFITFS